MSYYRDCFKPLSYFLISSLVLDLALLSTSSIDDLHQQNVSPSKFGLFNFTELEKTLYDVELLKVPLPESVLIKKNQNIEPGPNYMVLVSKHGQRYACELPWETPSGEVSPESQREPEMNVTTLLSSLKDRCLIKTMGWWTYEYCHGHFVRQYHMEGGLIIGKSIYLGFYANQTEWNEEQVNRVQGIIDSMKDSAGPGSFPVTYHRVTYVNGTVCDTTRKPRTTRVLIRCSLASDDRLYEVTERETCSYNLIIHTSLLCGHPLFDTGEKGRTQTLSCSPLLSQPDYEKYLEEQEQTEEETTSTEDEKPLFTGTSDPLQSALAGLLFPKLMGQSQTPDDLESTKQDPSLSQRDPSPFKQHSVSSKRDPSKQDHTPNKPHPFYSSSKTPTERATTSEKSPAQPSSPTGPASEENGEVKRLLVGEIEKSIEDLYKQLLSSLDEQASSDTAAAKLKKSIVSKYSEFESLKEKHRQQKEIEDRLTEAEKNFIEKKHPDSVREIFKPTKPSEQNKKNFLESPKRNLFEMKTPGKSEVERERSTVQPYEVQGVIGEDEETTDSELEEKEMEIGEDDEILTVERMTELEDAINEQLRESGIASADVKVVALPLNVMEMLMDEEEEDGETDETRVKMVLRLDDGQSPFSGKSQSLSQLFTSFWGGGGLPQDPSVSPEQQRVKELENNYDQVWGEQSESDKKRTVNNS